MLTRHAETRCQQRGIKPEVIEALLAYGRRARHGQKDVIFMDRTARARACADLGSASYARIADRLNAYLVLADDGRVITAAKRYRRLKF